MRAMILAAGRGTRMGHLTVATPKPLLPIAGKPMIAHTVERLAHRGIREIVINVSYLGDQITDYLGDGERFGVSIAYSHEPKGALETGGGIVAALPLLGRAPFIVVNSDIWTTFDFTSLAEPTRLAHLVLVPNPAHNPSGDFRLDGTKVTDNQGEFLTFSGIGSYSPALFANPPAARFSLAQILRLAVSNGDVTATRFDGDWVDVGTAERLTTANHLAASQQLNKSGV